MNKKLKSVIVWIAPWVLSFCLWAVGMFMIEKSAWWLLCCLLSTAVGFATGWVREPSPPLDQDDFADTVPAQRLFVVPAFNDRKPKPLVIEICEINGRGIVNALVKGDISPEHATSLIRRLTRQGGAS